LWYNNYIPKLVTMKKIILIALLALLCVSVKAQDKDTVGLKLPIKDGRLIYEGIIDAPNKSKMDLYNNARQWFVDYFKSSKDVIQNEDKDQGRIIGKGIILVPWKTVASNGFYDDKITIQIDVKDGKYRYRIYDMIITYPAIYNSVTGTTPSWDFTPEDMIAKLTGNGKFAASKGQCKKILGWINIATLQTIDSLTKAMNAKVDTF